MYKLSVVASIGLLLHATLCAIQRARIALPTHRAPVRVSS